MLILLCNASNVLAKTDSITIVKGKFIDQRNDTIHLTLYKDKFGLKENGSIKLSLPVNDGSFKFELKEVDQPVYFKLELENGEFPFDKEFILEPLDSILLTIADKQIYFTGNENWKFKFLYSLDSIQQTAIKKLMLNLESSLGSLNIETDLDIQSLLNLKRADSIYHSSLKLLERYKHGISDLVLDIILNDLYGKHQSGKIRTVLVQWPSARYLDDSTHRRQKMLDFFYEEIKKDTIQTSLLSKSLSANYLNYLVTGISLQNRVENPYRAKPPFEKAFHKAQLDYSNYPKFFLDKLLSTFLIYYPSSDDDYIAILNRYINNDIEEKKYLNNLTELETAFTPLKPAYNFELQDTSGRVHRLGDFKEKVVIMDFWFSGCVPCKVLASNMEEIIDFFQNDSRVVFVGVYVDKNLDLWKKEIRRGEYTHNSMVNLSTNGMGIKHPIIDFYNFRGFPKMLVINKKGDLVTANPPMPNGTKESKEKFKNLIFELMTN